MEASLHTNDHGDTIDDTGRIVNDDGSEPHGEDIADIAVWFTDYHGKVFVNFGKPVISLGLSPKQARDLAMQLRQHANHIERTPGL